ncbi:TPA: hypothetical protein ACH3X1_014593 [Trebouxia sp. C0004]
MECLSRLVKLRQLSITAEDMLWRKYSELPINTIQYKHPMLEEVCELAHYDIAAARRVTGFRGRFHWNKLSRTELQLYEYEYQLHLAKQAAQRKDRNRFADSSSSSLSNKVEVETDESETEQLASAILPRTTLIHQSGMAHLEAQVAAVILTLRIQGNDDAAATIPVEDPSEPYVELPAVIMPPATENWALDRLEQRSKALLDITNNRLWHPLASPLPGMMADLQQAMDADDYSNMPGLVDSYEDEFPEPASLLPAMMAELQLVEEAATTIRNRNPVHSPQQRLCRR